MENICYDVKEKKEKKEVVDITQLMDEVNSKTEDALISIDLDTHVALELDYSTNYNVKSLGQIMDFYELSKRKLRKDEIVQMIVMFEMESDNYEKVDERKRFWENLAELKEHTFFSKYILLDL